MICSRFYEKKKNRGYITYLSGILMETRPSQPSGGNLIVNDTMSEGDAGASIIGKEVGRVKGLGDNSTTRRDADGNNGGSVDGRGQYGLSLRKHRSNADNGK